MIYCTTYVAILQYLDTPSAHDPTQCTIVYKITVITEIQNSKDTYMKSGLNAKQDYQKSLTACLVTASFQVPYVPSNSVSC